MNEYKKQLVAWAPESLADRLRASALLLGVHSLVKDAQLDAILAEIKMREGGGPDVIPD